ncbi:MAG TPA: hypothetical protein VKU40_12790 [Thermoanaerobaculia bacterium]|nr:hypothetical protein [Thermoanaerobaculia bacterium]
MKRRIPHALFALLAAVVLLAGATYADEAPAIEIEQPADDGAAFAFESNNDAEANQSMPADGNLEELIFEVPEPQQMGCQYSCPNGNPMFCPEFIDTPPPTCVNFCCTYC